jgi:hypothetical protein
MIQPERRNSNVTANNLGRHKRVTGRICRACHVVQGSGKVGERLLIPSTAEGSSQNEDGQSERWVHVRESVSEAFNRSEGLNLKDCHAVRDGSENLSANEGEY